MISPYDLGNNLVEHTRRITIDELVRLANKQLRQKLIASKLSVLGKDLELTTSKTRFQGERFWFVCPICRKRKGVLYSHSDKIGCRECLGLKYKKQRFKGMTEQKLMG